MKGLLSVAILLISFAANATELSQFENARKISGQEARDYVDALDVAFKNKRIDCEMDYKPLHEKARQNMIKTVGERLSLVYNKSKLTTMYQMEHNNPGIVITTSLKRDGKTLMDELSFHLSPDSTEVRSFDFNYYEVKLVRINEGTILNPQIVQKEVLSLISSIRCTVM